MAHQKQSQKVHDAYCAGNLATLLEVLEHPIDFPNCIQPYALGLGKYPLEYAIYWSPFSFIQKLIDLGAEVNYPTDDGFPALIALLTTARSDKYDLLKLLLDNGADISQRGINDWTPLHYVVWHQDLKAIEILLAYGANPHLKTRIDEYSSPLEDAQTLGFTEAIRLLQKT